LKIKNILVTQAEPESEKSPYKELSLKNNVKIEFRPFVTVEGISARDFRKTRVEIPAHTSVIFTSRTAIDHFFRMCEEIRYTVPETMKYFCISESVAYYLQKYIVYRKRKIFFGNGKFIDLIDVILKHKDEKFLLPLSDIHKEEIPKTLDKHKINYTKAILYKTVSSDLSDFNKDNYDILVFYSPSGIKALFQNFPDFKQDSIKIASFGATTTKAAKEAGLKVDIQAPTLQAPSMTMALEQFIKKYNKENGKK
jgi:uroporphyrinogen-III synthase